jgi:hypothetical protein
MSVLEWIRKGMSASAGHQELVSPEQMLEKRSQLLESDKPIDVRRLMELYTVEELCETAEEYYRNIEDTSGLLTKPYVCLSETPELLAIFSQLLLGIKPVGGMDILDFGSGPGWAAHALTSLGAKFANCRRSLPQAPRFGATCCAEIPPLQWSRF